MTQAEDERAFESWIEKQVFDIPFSKPETLIDVLKTTFLAGAEHARAKWISVEERLPKSRELVLTVGDGKIAFGHMIRSGYWEVVRDGMELVDVTHWMDIPPAPEAESK